MGEIKNTDYPKLLREFVFLEENSRAVPGLDTVSVGRNVPRQPKRLYSRSREAIIKDFLSLYPDCSFKRSVLMRELPQECKTPSARDFARNCCVTCTNFRHKMTRLRKCGLLMDTLNSTRAMGAKRVCSSTPGFYSLKVLSWGEKCGLGKCEKCPKWELQVPEGQSEEVVTVSLWGDQMCPIKGKKIHGRWPKTMSLGDLVKSFNSDLAKLTSHLYVAYRQWSGWKLVCSSLQPGQVGTQEDFQMNVGMVLSESTTSSHMGANSRDFMMYPETLRGITPAGEPFEGALIFISTDLNHDRSQVQLIEKMTFDYVESKFGFRPSGKR